MSAPDPAPRPGPSPRPAHAGQPTSALPPAPAPGTDLGADLGAAAGFAWTALIRSPLPLLGAAAIWILAIALLAGVSVVGVLSFGMLSPAGQQGVEPTGTELVIMLALLFVPLLLATLCPLLLQAGTSRAGELIVAGQRPGLAQALFGGARVLLTALAAAVIVLIGTLLLILPGIAASILLVHAVPAAAAGASPLAAMRESVALARQHPAATLLSWAVALFMLAFALNTLFLAIPVFPFVFLAQVGLHHRLRGSALPKPRAA